MTRHIDFYEANKHNLISIKKQMIRFHSSSRSQQRVPEGSSLPIYCPRHVPTESVQIISGRLYSNYVQVGYVNLNVRVCVSKTCLHQDYSHSKLDDAISKMIGAGLKVSAIAWNVSFMRQTAVPMESGEWDAWFEAMDSGHPELDDGVLGKLRCTCTVRAVQFILESAPDRKEQCQDAWRAIVDLLAKVSACGWFEKCDAPFQEEVQGLRAMSVVGTEMHHSSAENRGLAETFRKKTQSPAKLTMHFGKVLAQSPAGLQLSAALCEVLAAQEKLSGWEDDLKGAMEVHRLLPDFVQDGFLTKDFDIVVPIAAKVGEIQSKLASLLSASTDKFQSDNRKDIDLLKELQIKIAGMIREALSRRVFHKVPSLAAAIQWCVNGCVMQPNASNADWDCHVNAIIAAKSMVVPRTQFAKHVGPDLAKSLGEFASDFSKFLTAAEQFCCWLKDSQDGKNSESLSVFQAEAFVEFTKYFHPVSADGGLFTFAFTEIHPDGPSWAREMKSWLSKWSQQRVSAKLSSCKNFVGLVLQEGISASEICLESVTGSVDGDEEPASIRSSNRELSSVACTVCFHADLKHEFDFGDTKVDLQSLCAASIYLPCARYTASVRVVSEQMLTSSTLMQSQNVEDMKQPGVSRTESAVNLMTVLKRWTQAGNWGAPCSKHT